MNWDHCFWNPYEEAARIFDELKVGVLFTVDNDPHGYVVIETPKAVAMFCPEFVRVRYLLNGKQEELKFEHVINKTKEGKAFHIQGEPDDRTTVRFRVG